MPRFLASCNSTEPGRQRVTVHDNELNLAVIARVAADVSALRDRGDDVLLLADHILERLGASASLDDSARGALLHYDFPGNVRELENMLERAVTLCTGKKITADDLHMREATARSTSTTAGVLGACGEREGLQDR